jgi:hypothetical protein
VGGYQESRKMKLVEIILMGRGKKGEIEEVNLTEIYCKHICKYHNVPPVQLLCANKIIRISMG